MKKNDPSAKTVLWIARITGTAMVLFTTLFGIGSLWEGAHKQHVTETHFDAMLIITFIIWGLGLLGLVWALWNEKKGGIFSFICFAFFLTLVMVRTENNPAKFVLLIFLFPSVLYISYWLMTRDEI